MLTSLARAFASLFFLTALAAACSSESTPSPQGDDDDDDVIDSGASNDAATGEDASSDASDAAVDKAARCAASFGDALTPPYGRLDGTVLAIVSPGNEACAMPNRDHVIVQVMMDGAAYRMVVNVQSDRGGDTKVRVRTLSHALLGPAFAEGWHTDLNLDYATDLGVHSTDAEWSAEDLPTLTRTIEDAVTLDESISVYGTSGRPESTHLIHRNRNAQDGALVLGANSSEPRWMLFHFAEQTF